MARDIGPKRAFRYVIKLDNLYFAEFADSRILVTHCQYEAQRFRVPKEARRMLETVQKGTRADGKRSDRIRIVRFNRKIIDYYG